MSSATLAAEPPVADRTRSAPTAVGLVTPLPPRPGGVAAVAGWLLAHQRELGVRYDVFDLAAREIPAARKLGDQRKEAQREPRQESLVTAGVLHPYESVRPATAAGQLGCAGEVRSRATR